MCTNYDTGSFHNKEKKKSSAESPTVKQSAVQDNKIDMFWSCCGWGKFGPEREDD